MGKLTMRLIKYFIGIISFVSIVCFAASSIFLSTIYTNMQYLNMKEASDIIYENLKAGKEYADILSEYQITNAFLSKEGKINSIMPNKMGNMFMMRNNNFSNLSEKGKYKNGMNEEFLYYKKSTDIGDIILLRNNRFSAEYMNSAYIILAVIFISAVIISVPIVSALGKKLTRPILKLQKAAMDITKGNFNIDVKVDTKDEIQELSNNIKDMAETIEKKTVMQRDFIANVSHDFKTPLSVIRNYSEAIYDDLLEEEDKKQYLKEIIHEVDRLNVLVMDILQLSKLQGGKVDILKKEQFNLSDFLFDFKNTFKIQLQNKNITFNIQVKDSSSDILADRNYLYRVVYNFIDNAIKFSNENGVVELCAEEEDNSIRVSVKDNGIGIDKNYIEDIWERYYKNKESGGMGIGLAICSEVLKLHDFEYGVVSKKGEMTEFYFIVQKIN
jgi:signal transduction histidine kinase